jgi:two-component system chemotaxis response regulator CheB
MRVLVVDDSAFMRKAITLMIESDPAFKVVDIARNGEEALEKIKTLKPDVVTLDIEMPVVDGMTVLRRLKLETTSPKPAVLVCSTLTKKGSVDALLAMRLGAADYINKDPGAFGAGNETVRQELMAKLKAIGETRSRQNAGQKGPARPADPTPNLSMKGADAVLIGSSTGGPPVLEEILTALPAEFPMPVVVAQHMPVLFTRSLSERLNDTCKIEVLHGEHGTKLKAGAAYIIPGGQHGRLVKGLLNELRLEVSPNPTDAPYKPSVNELLSSGARVLGSRCVGVVLTGMGDDGGRGAKEVHAAGGRMLAQCAETCVVYGMPRAVVEGGSALAALAPASIAEALNTLNSQADRELRKSA